MNLVYGKMAMSDADSTAHTDPSGRPFLYRLDNDNTLSLDSNFANDSVYSSSKVMHRVGEDRMEPDEYGNISRMKGVNEIFGDYSMSNYNLSFFDANLTEPV